jgi:hypothetical protein
MALLGHSSAEMSLRYGRLFDATVRADYERGLTLAKQRLGPVLPQAPAGEPDSNWRELPLIKSRMAGGYCLRTAAQGVCAYTNICEHCPNYRSEPALLAVLSAQHRRASPRRRRPTTRLERRSQPPRRTRRAPRCDHRQHQRRIDLTTTPHRRRSPSTAPEPR